MKITRFVEAVSHFPQKRLTNADLEKMVDTSDEWIRERTGIKERRVVEKGQAASDLGTAAVNKLLKSVDCPPEELDAIIVATTTPDMLFPNTACLIQNNIGAKNAWGFDLGAACSGFVYAISVADQFIRTGHCRKIVVVGVDIMSSIVDYTERATCIIFGDGAGAAYLEGLDAPTNELGIIDTILKADGRGRELLYMKGGGSLHPATHETVDQKLHFIRQDGRVVFKEAVTSLANVTNEILERNKLKSDDLDFFVCHQANMRIIDATAKRLGLKPEQVINNIDLYGNTTAATIPSCLAKGSAEGRIKKGDLVLITTFGAGFTGGASLFRWG